MRKVTMLVLLAAFAAIAQRAWAQESAPAGQTSQQQKAADQVRIAVQKICPVMGGKLGSMGDPVKTKIDGEEVFLCCDGCSGEKANKDHWATIHANLAKAQAKCPVMDKPLPKNAKSVVVEGRVVYICCPGCAAKIKADPKTYLEKVDALYAASIKAKPDAK